MALPKDFAELNNLVAAYTPILVMVVMMIIYQVYQHNESIALLETHHLAVEGAGCNCNPYANKAKYFGVASDSIGTKVHGATFDPTAINPSGGRDGFFGGSEPPVFYDIGNVRAQRTTRGDATGVLRDAAGNPVMDAAGNVVMAQGVAYSAPAAGSGGSPFMTTAQRRAMYSRNNQDATRTLGDANSRRNMYGSRDQHYMRRNQEGFFLPEDKQEGAGPVTDDDFLAAATGIPSY